MKEWSLWKPFVGHLFCVHFGNPYKGIMMGAVPRAEATVLSASASWLFHKAKQTTRHLKCLNTVAKELWSINTDESFVLINSLLFSFRPAVGL